MGWQITNRSTSGAAASATVSAPTASGTNIQVTRLRAIQCRVAGTTAGQDLLTVKDGTTVIANFDVSIPANGSDQVTLSDLDLRASPGNDLVIAFASGISAARENINAQGDFVPQGYPMFQT